MFGGPYIAPSCRVSGNHVDQCVLIKTRALIIKKMAARRWDWVQLLTAVFLHLTLPCMCQGRAEQSYSEALFMKFLADGRVSATFDFSTVWSVHPLLFSNPGNGESVFFTSRW